MAVAAHEFERHADAFDAVAAADARLVKVADVDAHEGPVWVESEQALYFTSVPRPAADGPPQVAIRRLRLDGLSARDVTTVCETTACANGMTLDRDGSLLVCEQGTRSAPARIARLDPANGALETVVDAWRGVPLGSPNDVVVAADDSVWFTDPSYGHLQRFRPPPVVGDHVYRLERPSGRLTVVADSFDKPNGLAFAPDESVLYVTDSGANHEPGSFDARRPHHIVAFDVHDDGRLGAARLFAVTWPGFPDGIKVDAEGRVYASACSGVQVFDPAGDLIGEIRLPGAVNFCFADDVLLITTDTAVWAAVLNAKGA